jgi:hypothetical protein
MLNAWMLIVGLVGLITAVIIATVRIKKVRNKRTQKSFKPYANTADIRNLPEYKSAKKKYHLVIASVIVMMLVSILSVTVISARPVAVDVAKPDYENRDIMFCLDISGSMNDYVKDMLFYFSDKIVPQLKGQRLGITVFDGTYLSLSPLTDDYLAFAEMLKSVAENPFEYSSALYNISHSMSEIGLGLTGCVNNFDKLEEERARDIILVTDNYSNDPPEVELTTAGNYAKQYNIAVYGISTSDSRSQEEIDNIDEGSTRENNTEKEFREMTLSTGGAYFAMSKWSTEEKSASQITDRIMEQSAARYEGTDTLVHTDVPLVPTIIAAVSLGIFFILIWRLGL